MTQLLTDRLRLRPLQPGDLPAFVAYRAQPSVARYQSWHSRYSMADANGLLAAQRGASFGKAGDWLQLAALDRTTGTLCGDCAVRVVTDQPATAEIGITLAPNNQGKGLATEATYRVDHSTLRPVRHTPGVRASRRSQPTRPTPPREPTLPLRSTPH